jgi:hypothetical protein
MNASTARPSRLVRLLAATALAAGLAVALSACGGPNWGSCPQGQVKVGSALGAPECTYQP